MNPGRTIAASSVNGAANNHPAHLVRGQLDTESLWYAAHQSTDMRLNYLTGFSSQSTLTITQRPLNFAMCK